ncbi:hypothetical protein [Oceanobacillus sp. FSL W7-1293]|uniref:hypothetical protein n=1 Tax=Oceanobacillus sp. FSL W7-1293 TaxID=2921699 RepID=UPI0030D25AAD
MGEKALLHQIPDEERENSMEWKLDYDEWYLFFYERQLSYKFIKDKQNEWG